MDATVPTDLESIPPGPELAVVLASLDWDRLTGHDLIRALKAQKRMVAHYQAGALWSMNQIVTHYQHIAEDEQVTTLIESPQTCSLRFPTS